MATNFKLSDAINNSEYYNNSYIKNFKYIVENCTYPQYFKNLNIKNLSNWKEYYYPKDAVITSNLLPEINFTDEGGTKSRTINYLFKPYQGGNLLTYIDNINSFDINNCDVSISIPSMIKWFDASLVKNENDYTLNITANDNLGPLEKSADIVITAKGVNNGKDASLLIEVKQAGGRTHRIPVRVNITKTTLYKDYTFGAVIEIYLDNSLKRIEASAYSDSSFIADNYTKYGPNQIYLEASEVEAKIDMRCHAIDGMHRPGIGEDEIIDQTSTTFSYDCSMYYKASDGEKMFIVGKSRIDAPRLDYVNPTDGPIVINPLGVWLNGDSAQLKQYKITPAAPKSIGGVKYGGDDFTHNINIYEIFFDITIK